MVLSFKRTVEGLCGSIRASHFESARDDGSDEDRRAGEYVLAQHARLMDWLRLPFRMLTLFFDAWGIVRAGRPFHRQSRQQQLRQIESWSRSPLEAFRDFIRFHESLVIFDEYSRRDERA